MKDDFGSAEQRLAQARKQLRLASEDIDDPEMVTEIVALLERIEEIEAELGPTVVTDGGQPVDDTDAPELRIESEWATFEVTNKSQAKAVFPVVQQMFVQWLGEAPQAGTMETTVEKKSVFTQCPDCGYEWAFNGKYPKQATCPSCQTHVNCYKNEIEDDDTKRELITDGGQPVLEVTGSLDPATASEMRPPTDGFFVIDEERDEWLVARPRNGGDA